MSGATYDELAKLLNPEQLRAATTTEGPLLILAGAGSGKTRVLVHRAAYILEEGLARPWELFLVTFTNKAAREMRERLEKLIGPEVKSAWIGTFHALSARILRYEGHRLGFNQSFTIYDADDAKRLVKKTMEEMGVDTSKHYGVTPAQIGSEIDRAKNKGWGPERYAQEADRRHDPVASLAKAVFFKYQNALRRANAMDFGDLLLLTVQLLAHHPEAKQRFAERFRYVMVDEFQDTNAVQYDILRHLTSVHHNLAVVGDDDQSIYRWRGAEVANILGFDKKHQGAAVVKLEQNYRSTKNIITAANAVIRQNTKRHDKTLFTEARPGAPVYLAMFDYGDQEAYFIAQLIRARIDKGDDPRGVAVLYRQNAQSRPFEEQLRKMRVPYTLVGGTGFYERREVKDILSYLRLIANPRSRQDFERVLNVPPRKIGATTLTRLREAADAAGVEGVEILGLPDDTLAGAGLKPATIKRLRDLAKLFVALEAYSQDASAEDVAHRVIEAIDYEAYLKSDDPASAEDRIANVEELVSSIAEHEDELGSLEPGPTEADGGFGLAGARTPLQAFLDQASLVQPDDDSQGEGGGGVSLLTLHSAKGLEFPVVYLVGMEELTFPTRRVLEENDPQGLEEERRLCYVGMTRAMKELVLTGARMRRIYGQAEPRRPSRFLGELPPRVVASLPLTSTATVAAPGPASVPQGGNWPAAAVDRGGDRIEYDEPPPRSLPTRAAEPDVRRVPTGPDPQVGDRVQHNLFGLGVVISRDAPGPTGRISIRFGQEVRKVVSRFVQRVQ
ncbi:MAG: UvrD-helicase domain-containing protein [Myxococcales bacterium]|nr:UvrD-helicase domain-containing protein [Myxococcales bacterium]